MILTKYEIETYGSIETSTMKLFDIAVQLLREQNSPKSSDINLDVSISLDEYMELCGIAKSESSEDKTRRTLNRDLHALLDIILERTKRFGYDFEMSHLFSGGALWDGYICLTFTSEMGKHLMHKYGLMTRRINRLLKRSMRKMIKRNRDKSGGKMNE